jgi:conjugative relaxase-like TrwC/TraI family protein
MIQSQSCGQAKSYFSDSLSQADYYTSDQEHSGEFRGALAHRLGLNGRIAKDAFFMLCENVNPKTGDKLTKRTKDNRTIGYDINFHCPKSVSILHALAKDNHLQHAFERAVFETMSDIESDVLTRVRKKSQCEDRKTGELLFADFIHQTARPVKDQAPDPHLHAHCFVFNATWDEAEQTIKAAQFRDIKRDMPYYQARFHKRLADALIGLGYNIRRTDKSFEVVGVPPAVIDLFSKRTDEIGRIAKELGLTDKNDIAELGARTRAKKQKGLSMAELKAEWKRQIASLNLDATSGNRAIRFAPKAVIPLIVAKECVDHALRHSFERASVVAERRILEQAFRFCLGHDSVGLEALSEAFEQEPTIIKVKEGNRFLCTTSEVLQEEQVMVELANFGQNQLQPLYSTAPKLELTGEQAAAVEHVLTTTNTVSIIRGAAGSGKTTLMKEAAAKITAAGKNLTVLAPTAQASRDVLRSEGFEHAETVAKFLNDTQAQMRIRDQVVWVDEAGLLGTTDMKALLSIASSYNARLILGGDTKQHASVVRGDALRILNKVAGIEAQEVSKIFRQKHADYLEAVQELSKGHIEQGFDRLDKIGFVRETDPQDSTTPLVKDYMRAVSGGKSVLVISPTHEHGREVTTALREALRKSNKLDSQDHLARKLTSVNLTQAQRGDWQHYRVGQFVQFGLHAPGIRSGSKWTVSAVENGQVQITNDMGATIILPLQKAKAFDVYEVADLPLARGDKISITKNGFDTNMRRLNNGQALEVISFSDEGEIICRNTKSNNVFTLDKNFGHFNHAYCITSHASQGKTVDEVFISQPTGTFAATNAKQFYVSVSRGRDQAHIYTDDKEGLRDHVTDLGDRLSAMELMGRFVENGAGMMKDGFGAGMTKAFASQHLLNQNRITPL